MSIAEDKKNSEGKKQITICRRENYTISLLSLRPSAAQFSFTQT
jgi:hypothetical protein